MAAYDQAPSSFSLCPHKTLEMEDIRVNKSAQVFVLIIVVGAVNAFAQEQAPKPTYQEGDFWQYKVSEKGITTRATTAALNGTYELRYTQGKVKAFLLNGPDKDEIKVGHDTTGEYLLLLLGGTDERQSLNFPLNVGKRWTYSFRSKAPGARDYDHYNVAVNVIGARAGGHDCRDIQSF
jgi:hypothetical protein